MGGRIAEISGNLVYAGLILTILVVISGVFLVILILIWIFRSLLLSSMGEESAEEIQIQKVGLFDAPASHWWVDRYDQWLFRLEESVRINFSQTPARLFAGSMVLAGISGGVLAGAGYLLVGPETVWPVLFVVVLGNGLSAWWLGRPMTAMFEPFGDGGPKSLGGGGGVIIGDPLD